MGGGDLNLKKSWHPSTMRNMEKVWKAEQKHDQEKKRIAELQREIQQEKAREDIKKYAEESGVLEKKDECKLEWMYKGPNNQVNREEYLLGRSIDKTFEQAQESEKSSFGAGLAELDKSTSGNLITPETHQVDLARKLQEDPLFAIKKKEIESRSQLLNNPVKLKKLKQYLQSRSEKKSKREKKSKKKKHRKRDSSDNDDDGDDGDLDAMLLAKYKKLKKKLSKTDLESLKKECDTSESEEEEEVHVKSQDNKRSKDQGRSDSKRQRSDDRSSQPRRRPGGDYPQQRKPNSDNSFRYRRDAIEKQDSKPGKVKLSEEEMERRRAEMLDNAKWREKEREKNIARHKEEEAREKNQSKNYDKDFLRKQLSYAASQGTVESRIRSNINNIQRSSVAMDKNFARR